MVLVKPEEWRATSVSKTELLQFDGGTGENLPAKTVRPPGAAVGFQPLRRVQPVGGQAALDLFIAYSIQALPQK